MRRVADLSDTWKPAAIGHNGGPPLDVSWNAWVWRRAHKKAWATPGHDIAMLRLRRAERLGLSYREYTGVLMDRGVHLGGLVLVMRGDVSEAVVMSKLATLHDCRVLVCTPDPSETFASWLRRAGMEIAREASSAAIQDFSQRTELPPSALFLVGTRADRALAERAGLGLHVDANRYFA